MVTVYKYLSFVSETVLSVIEHHYDTTTNLTDLHLTLQTTDSLVERSLYVRILRD